MPDSDMALLIRHYIGPTSVRHPEPRMATTKPEVEITLEQKEMPVLQRLFIVIYMEI